MVYSGVGNINNSQKWLHGNNETETLPISIILAVLLIKWVTNFTDEDVPSAARHGVGEHTSSAVCVNLSKLWERVASMIELYGVFYKHNVYVANSPTNHYLLKKL